MSSETAPTDTSPQVDPPVPIEPGTKATVDTMNGQSGSAQATSEANIAATDPNTGVPPTPSGDKTAIADANIDIKAADTAEGAVSGATVVAPDTGSTPASTKKGKDPKRRSSGVPEHKSKKGKKKEIVTNLLCEPGEYYFARMKGHPEWPSVICDEEMLPEIIMGSRPVTARRPDGSYREDFANGGKNERERTYPVMFLGTNEFAWMPNVDLRKITKEDVQEPEKIKGIKKSLLEAYKIAQQFHDLDHFKQILFNFETARAEEEKNYAEKLAKDEEKAAKKASEKVDQKDKKKRKSTATVGDDEMDVDEDEAAAPKSSKKRKATDADDTGKPAKTPKQIKLTPKVNGDSAKSKKAKTPKAKPPKEEPAMSESDRLEKKEKSVLYLRHKLQKGFLQTTAPQESEMDAMAQHFDTLQQYKELEVGIIRKTKIHKVLKAILKLDSIPLDDKFGFRKRSNELLQHWNKILSEEVGVTSNGVGDDEKPDRQRTEAAQSDGPKSEEPQAVEATTGSKADVPVPTTEPAAAPVETNLPGNDAKDEATDGDASMTEAKSD